MGNTNQRQVWDKHAPDYDKKITFGERNLLCLLYTSPSPRDS